MNKLLSTTAMVVALGFPAMTLAQSTSSATTSESQQLTGGKSGFLAERGQSDLYASDLIGHDVYARRASGEATASNKQTAASGESSQDMVAMNRADLEEMDAIGQINEIVLSHDGQVRALVIGVGGFLGMGEQDVAVTMDQVKFASDADDQSQTYIVVNFGSDLLRDAPVYDRTSAKNEAATESTDGARSDQTAGSDAVEDADGTLANDRAAFAAPQLEREGYNRVEATDVSTEMLMGKSVYDVDDNDVGTVEDMILDDQGAITEVIIDFGGFLGIGSSQASLRFEELTIMTNEGYEDVRLYVDATKEQIQNLPRHTASN